MSHLFEISILKFLVSDLESRIDEKEQAHDQYKARTDATIRSDQDKIKRLEELNNGLSSTNQQQAEEINSLRLELEACPPPKRQHSGEATDLPSREPRQKRLPIKVPGPSEDDLTQWEQSNDLGMSSKPGGPDWPIIPSSQTSSSIDDSSDEPEPSPDQDEDFLDITQDENMEARRDSYKRTPEQDDRSNKFENTVAPSRRPILGVNSTARPPLGIKTHWNSVNMPVKTFSSHITKPLKTYSRRPVLDVNSHTTPTRDHSLRKDTHMSVEGSSLSSRCPILDINSHTTTPTHDAGRDHTLHLSGTWQDTHTSLKGSQRRPVLDVNTSTTHTTVHVNNSVRDPGRLAIRPSKEIYMPAPSTPKRTTLPAATSTRHTSVIRPVRPDPLAVANSARNVPTASPAIPRRDLLHVLKSPRKASPPAPPRRRPGRRQHRIGADLDPPEREPAPRHKIPPDVLISWRGNIDDSIQLPDSLKGTVERLINDKDLHQIFIKVPHGDCVTARGRNLPTILTTAERKVVKRLAVGQSLRIPENAACFHCVNARRACVRKFAKDFFVLMELPRQLVDDEEDVARHYRMNRHLKSWEIGRIYGPQKKK